MFRVMECLGVKGAMLCKLRCYRSASTSDEGEIWEDDSYESDMENRPQDDKAQTVVVGISLFLNFSTALQSFQESHTSSSFLKLLFTFLSGLIPSSILNEVLMFLLRSIQSIRRVLRKNIHGCEVVEYVVCPKCNALYCLRDCIVGHNGGEESKLCDFVEYSKHPHPSRRTKCNAMLLKKISVGNRTKLVQCKTCLQ